MSLKVPCSYQAGRKLFHHTGLTVLALAAIGSAASAQTASKKSDAPNPVAPPSPKLGSLSLKQAGAYLHQPMRFEPNRGQAPKSAAFATGLLSPQKVYLSASGIQFNLPRPVDKSNVASKTPHVPQGTQQITMNFVAANRSPEIVGERKMSGITNYLDGGPSAQYKGVPGFAQVRYKDLYKGVDAVVHSDGKNLEYDFVVAPGSDANQVRLKFKGAGNMAIAHDGSLRMATQDGTVAHEALKAYQLDADGKRQLVAARFEMQPSGTVGFRVGKYDAKRPLVIDPAVVYYQGYINQAGNRNETVTAVAFRPGSTAGEMYIAFTYDYNAQGSGAPTNKQIGVIKINNQGNGWLTTWGSGANSGVCDDEPTGIAVDNVGDVYVCGRTNGPLASSNSVQYQTTYNATYPTRAGGSSAYTGFIAILSGEDRNGIYGGSLIYSSFLGGENTEPKSIAVSPVVPSVAYVVGSTQNTNLPMVAALPGHGTWPGVQQAFLTKINMPKENASYNNSIIFQSYWGGTNGLSTANAVRVSNGSMYVTGSTQASNFPTQAYGSTSSSLLTYHSGQDAFFSLITPPSGSTTTSSVVASVLIGGSGIEYGNSLAVTGEFIVNPVQVFLTGETRSTDFPTVNPLSTNSSLSGFSDAFVTKLVFNQGSLTMPYSTYLGGTGADSGADIAISIDSSLPVNPSKDAVTVVGTAAPVTGIPGLVFSPGADLNQIFLVKMAMDSATVLNSFQIGFANDDIATAIADDGRGGLLVGGTTKSPNLGGQYPFPIDYNTYPNALPAKFYQAGFDGLVSRLDLRTTNNRAVYYVPANLPNSPGTGQVASDGVSKEVFYNNPQGYLSYGPYTTQVAAGNNLASFKLQVDNNTLDNANVVRLDVYDADANQILGSRDVTRREFAGTYTNQDFVVPFYYDFASQYYQHHRVEFRVWHYGTSYVKLTSLGTSAVLFNMNEVYHFPANTGQGRFESDGGYSMNIAQDSAGYLSYGPYVTNVETSPGHQVATWQMIIDNNTNDNIPVVLLDVYDADANQVVASMQVTRQQFTATNTPQSFNLPFTWSAARAGHRIEIRNYWFGYAYIKQYYIGITGTQ